MNPIRSACKELLDETQCRPRRSPVAVDPRHRPRRPGSILRPACVRGAAVVLAHPRPRRRADRDLGHPFLSSIRPIRHLHLQGFALITDFTPFPALLGGSLIGLAAVALMAFNGRIAGMTGIMTGLLPPFGADWGWRAAFLL